MSGHLQAWERQGLIWKANLSPAQKLVLMAYDSFANSQGESCFPSYQTIATLTGYSKRTVITTVNELVKLKILGRKRRKNSDGSNTSNDYRIIYKSLQGLVNRLHPPSENISPPLVKLFHHPSENISPPSEIISPDLPSDLSIDQPNSERRTRARKNLDLNSETSTPSELPLKPAIMTLDDETHTTDNKTTLEGEIPTTEITSIIPCNHKSLGFPIEEKGSAAAQIFYTDGYTDITNLVNTYDRYRGQWRAIGTLPSPRIVEGMQAYRLRYKGSDSEFLEFFKKLMQVARVTGGKWFRGRLTPSQIFNPDRLPLAEFWDEANCLPEISEEGIAAIAAASPQEIQAAQLQQSPSELSRLRAEQERWDKNQQLIAATCGREWIPTPAPGHSERV